MRDFLAKTNLTARGLVRYVETRLRCGLLHRKLGADKMYWSRGVYSLLDLNPATERASHSLLQEFKHPRDRVSLAQANANVLAAKPSQRTFRIIRRDGTMRVLSEYIEVLFDSAGNPESALGLLRDVTDEWDEAEREKLFEQRFAALDKHPGIIVHSVRPDGFVTCLLGGIPDRESEMKRRFGHSWRELIHPEDLPGTLEDLRAAQKEKKPTTTENRVRTPEGSYRWRRSSFTPVFDEKGSVVEILSISRDIEREKTLPAGEDANGPVTGAQVRAARAIKRWSVQDLSNISCISPSVIRRIEDYDGITRGVEDALIAIRNSLTQAGIHFFVTGTGKPGVRPA